MRAPPDTLARRGGLRPEGSVCVRVHKLDHMWCCRARSLKDVHATSDRRAEVYAADQCPVLGWIPRQRPPTRSLASRGSRYSERLGAAGLGSSTPLSSVRAEDASR